MHTMSLSFIVFFLTESNIEFADLGSIDLEVSIYHKKFTYNGSNRSHHNTIVKRRKFFIRVSGVTSDRGFLSSSASHGSLS
jgi:hypothetical protein